MTIEEEQAAEVERLERERDALREENEHFMEQLALRSESAMAKDMQEIMRINETLREENARLREALKPFSKNNWSEDWHDGSDCEISVQLRDIRRAASLVDGYVWTPDE